MRCGRSGRYGVECEVRSAKCEVRSAKCGVRSAECEVRSAKCGVGWAVVKIYGGFIGRRKNGAQQRKEVGMLFGRKKEAFTVRGMSCSHCEKSVVDGVGEIDGVAKVKADADADRVEVFYKGDAPDMVAIRNKIVELGYEVV